MQYYPSEYKSHLPHPHCIKVSTAGLGGMLKYVSKIGMGRIAACEYQLLIYVGRLLKETHGLHLIGTAKDKTSVLFFVLENCETAEIGAPLNTKRAVQLSADPHQPLRVGLNFIPDF
ncbi:MAG: hypothetical protein RL571_2941 [Pseudomonadota bacterium]|jgi:selenocysteine lyase/cysteine desulfurase